MGHKARVKRIDRRTASTDAIVRQGAETLRQGAETLALIAATQADLVEQSLESKQLLRESRQLLEKANATSERVTHAVEDQRVAIIQWNLRQEEQRMLEVLSTTREMVESLRESRREGLEEARAQRAALYARIDELKGGGPATE